MILYSTRKNNTPISGTPLLVDVRNMKNGFEAPFTMAVTSTESGTTGEVSISFDEGITFTPWVNGAVNQSTGNNVARLDAGETPTHLKVERKAGSGAVHFTVNK